MRQIYIPLDFFEYNFFILKSELLHTPIMLQKSENRVSLKYLEYLTFDSAVVTSSVGVLTNINIEKTFLSS